MGISRRATLRWVCAVLLALAIAGGLPPATPTLTIAGQEVTEADLYQALTFRGIVGFPSDDLTVRQSFADPAYSSSAYGVPLTSSETAEVTRRAEVGRSIDLAAQWADENSSAYAGSWIDHTSGGMPVFMIKGEQLAAEAGIGARLPPGLKAQFRPARYSLRELNVIQDEIEAQRSQLIADGIPLVSTSIQTPRNAVEVGLSRVGPELESRVKDRFGDAVSVVLDTYSPTEDACGDSNCGPAKGGIAIYSLQSGNSCTAGFMVKVVTGTDYRGVVTAGHCFRVKDSGLGDDWYHPVTGPDLLIGEAERQTWYEGADADVGLIDLGVVPADRNNFYVNGSIRSLTDIVLDSWQQIGDVVCRQGITSEYTCGYIVDTDETRPSTIDGVGTRNIDHQWVVAFDSLGGDSGGPIFFGNDGYGIHIHSGTPAEQRGWYSTVMWMQNEYMARWSVDFNFCVTDAC